ncbi:MAG TPA: hypothetical protein VIO14_05810 [Dehalococcoidia bacterium]
MDEGHAAARRSLVLNAAVFTPLFVLALAGVALALLTGAWVLLVIAAFVAFLFGYQGIQSLRDLGAEPVTLTGQVARRWSRADFIVFRQGYYIMVQRQVFRIPAEEYLDLDPGDVVEVTYFPHTNTVVRLTRKPPEAGT